MATERRTLFLALAWVALAGTSFSQTTHSESPDTAASLRTYEVVSVKPSAAATANFHLGFTQDGVSAVNAPLLMVLRVAYNLFGALDDRFIGLPDWAKTERFDIEGKVSPEDVNAYKKASGDLRRQMLQALLADRFRLQTHREMREQAIYQTVVAKGGLKLVDASPQEIEKPTMSWNKNQIDSTAMTMAQLMPILTQITQRTVVDKTGLAGKYDLHLRWTPDTPGSGNDDAVSSGPSIYTAVQEQLGLKLEPAKAPVEFLIVDRVERPSEN